MRHVLPCAALVIVLFLAVPMMPLGPAATAKGAPLSGGFVDTIRFIQQPNQNQALLDLKSGAMDLYTFPLRTVSSIGAAHADPGLRTIDAVGGEDNLFVNPVPVDPVQAPGVFNPFAIREVRQGLNYLVDRNHLNTILFGGSGAPHAAVWNDASPEVARDPFFFHDVNQGASYDFNRAKTMIFEALTAAGATYDGTRWTWQGNPIVVPFVIRLEDDRLQLGNYVADQVELLGLSVTRRYLTAGAAFQIVYNGPPDTGAWMLYTEGWAATQVNRWADADLDFFHCGGEGSAVWFFYTVPAALRDACSKLLFGQFSTRAERQQLIENGVTLALTDSVRVWLVSHQIYAYSLRVTALVTDAAGGPWSPFTMRTARFASPGGILTVGSRFQFFSPYQPWQGFGWLYDLLVGQTIMDPGVTLHPQTGEYIPVRSDFQTTTAGPSGTLIVPSTALAWDPASMGFTTVAPGTSSMSKVRFQYTFGNWHHGAPMGIEDVLYNIALIARRTQGDVAAHDFDAVNFHDRLFMSLFRGLQVIDPTTLDIYIDYWHLDPSFIAAAADVWPATPWEVGELAMATTLHDHTRISEISAANEGLDPIDLAMGPTIGFMDDEISSGNIVTSGAGVTRPPGLQSLITQSEAEARWSALLSWRATHNHYFVSNGPYSLSVADPVVGEAIVTNFAAYPFAATRWDGLLNLAVPTLVIDEFDGVVPGEEADVSLFTKVGGQPYSSATVQYRIRSLDSPTMMLTGDAVLVAPGEWQVNLNPAFTETLAPGTYLFQGAAIGSGTSTVVFAERTFTVSSKHNDQMSVITGVPPHKRTEAALQI